MRGLGSFVVDDIVVTEDYFMKKHKYFMVSDSRGKYIKLTPNQYNFYKTMIPWFLKTDDETKLKEVLSEYTNGAIAFEALKKSLQEHNLLREATAERKGTVEAEFTSNRLCEIPLDKFQKKYAKGLNMCWYLLVIVALLSVIAATAIGVRYVQVNHGFSFLRNENTKLTWDNIENINLWIILIGGFLCIFGHEIGHLLSAVHYGIEWKTITIALRWGISLVYYVKYKNFYAHKSRNKLIVILSGVIMNLTMANLFFLLYVNSPHIEYAFIILINLLGMLNNLLPKGTSDGYHAFCTIIGIEGIRWKMLKNISNVMKNPGKISQYCKQKESVVLFAYFIVSYGISLYGCYKIILSAGEWFLLLESNEIRNYARYGFTSLVCLGVIGNLIKLFKNVKEM